MLLPCVDCIVAYRSIIATAGVTAVADAAAATKSPANLLYIVRVSMLVSVF